MWNEEQIEEYLKNNLSESRYNHSLSVRDTAVMLARKHGEDELKARIAGLVHDCAKNKNNKEIVEMVEENGYNIDMVCKNSPDLLHGLAGAIIAKNLMGIQDEDVLNSIAYHTTGRKEMSLLEKIIYIADYIEPLRKFPGVDNLRETVQKDLEEGILLSFNNTINYVISLGQLLHMDTIEARNYLIIKKCRWRYGKTE